VNIKIGFKNNIHKNLTQGKIGQKGFALHKKLVSLGEVIGTDRNELNIINAEAQTDVDKAKREIELAFKVNAEAAGV
jgi:dTDP-4-dehydrorhamnose reductase